MKLPAFIENYIVGFSAKDLIYLFVIACVLILFANGCGAKKDPNIEIKKPVLQQTVDKKDKSGTSYTEIKGTIYTQDQMNQLADSFRRELKKGKVLSVINTVTPPVHDTVPVLVYVDSSQHLMSASDSTKNYRLGFTGNWKTKQGQFTLDISPDSASYVTTMKERLFRSNILTTNVYHTNDLFKPTMGNVYTAKAPRSLLDFDVFLGYDPFLKKLVVAPGVGIHIFSIKRKN